MIQLEHQEMAREEVQRGREVMWLDRCAVHEYEVTNESVLFMYKLNKADWTHRLWRAGNIGKVALRVPFFLCLCSKCNILTGVLDVNMGFAQPDWLQGMMAFTHSALLPGSCYTMVSIQTLQELWSRCAVPGFKDATLFLVISLVWELTASPDTQGVWLSPLPALLLNESGYSCCVLCLALIGWLQQQAHDWWASYLCLKGWLVLGNNLGAVDPHCARVPNSRPQANP